MPLGVKAFKDLRVTVRTRPVNVYASAVRNMCLPNVDGARGHTPLANERIVDSQDFISDRFKLTLCSMPVRHHDDSHPFLQFRRIRESDCNNFNTPCHRTYITCRPVAQDGNNFLMRESMPSCKQMGFCPNRGLCYSDAD